MSERTTRNGNDEHTRSPNIEKQDENTRSEKDRPSLSVEAGEPPNVVEEPLALSDNSEPVGFFARLWGVLRGTVATSRRMDESGGTEERNKASSQR